MTRVFPSISLASVGKQTDPCYCCNRSRMALPPKVLSVNVSCLLSFSQEQCLIATNANPCTGRKGPSLHSTQRVRSLKWLQMLLAALLVNVQRACTLHAPPTSRAWGKGARVDRGRSVTMEVAWGVQNETTQVHDGIKCGNARWAKGITERVGAARC